MKGEGALLLAQFGVEKVLLLALDIVDNHAREDGARNDGLDPAHLILHDKPVRVALQVVVRQCLGNSALSAVVHAPPAVEAHWQLAAVADDLRIMVTLLACLDVFWTAQRHAVSESSVFEAEDAAPLPVVYLQLWRSKVWAVGLPGTLSGIQLDELIEVKVV